MQAVRLYGRDWDRVRYHMGETKTVTQIINRTTNVINFIRKNPHVEYADILEILVKNKHKTYKK